MLGRIVTVLKARWFVALVGVLLLALLIWFVGPLIAIADARPLANEYVRLAVIAVLIVAWGFWTLYRAMKAKQSNDKFIAEIAKEGADDAAYASAGEIALLKTRLEEALAVLKKTKLGGAVGRQYLYELPWYILIGPPGSGKTTALINCGLNFPLAEKYGNDSLRGVGGTRNCDWWFTNEAVLLDTAGRYTTQDSQKSVDQASWLGFLKLLKKYRPRQPINGAIVAVSVTEITAATEAQRMALAQSVRQRIRELHDELGIRFPIYVLFTKMDLLAGFVEYFDDLGREEREQVWGLTLDYDETGKADPLEGFATEFDRLLARLNDREVERVHQEPDLQRRTSIFAFPSQVASLKTAADAFLREVFQPSRFEERPLLRGVYLTSGTQEGTPMDRIMGALSAQFRIERRRLSAFSGRGRSYFLASLLRDVIFPEAALVGKNRRQERRYFWLQRGALAAAVLAVVVLAGLWFTSYQANRDLLARVDEGAEQYRRDVAKVNTARIEDADLAAILPALNTLNQMPTGYANRDADVPMSMTYGLYQGGRVGAETVAAYRRALNMMMLPRLLLRLEQQIQTNMERPDYLYEALKVYLMLGAQGRMDADLVRLWMNLDWQAAFPGQENARGRAALMQHLDALIAEPVRPIPLNGPLIEQARRTLGGMSLAERIYNRIKQSQAARQLPEWRVVDHAGAAAGRVFERKSARSLFEGVPGLYTYNGFQKVFLPALGPATRELGAESWVFGAQQRSALDVLAERQLERQVLALYMDDYAARWEGLLADVSIISFRNLANAAELLNILSGPNSPLRNLLVEVVRETQLTRPPPDAEKDTAQKAADAAGAAAQRNPAAARLSGIVGQAATAAGEAPPGQAVENRFKPLAEFVLGREGTPPPLEDVIKKLNELYFDLNKMVASLSQEETLRDFSRGGTSRAVVQQLASTASRVPPPVSNWLSSAAQASSTVAVHNARAQLNDIWSAKVLPVCRRATENRYPIYADGASEVNLEDFKRLFAPGGLIDDFFNQNLKPFVDTSQRPWQWQRVDNVDLGIPNRVLLQFQAAAAIRDGFFNGSNLQVQFDLTPLSLDRSANQVMIDIDGQTVSYSHGPQRATRLQWPGPNPANGVRVVFSPSIPGEPSGLSKEGPWAWFRALSEAKISDAGVPDRFKLTFGIGRRTAEFDLRANSVANPFHKGALETFRCPNAL